MDSFIVVRGNGRTIKVTAGDDGTINEDTLRGAFYLEKNVPIALCRNEIALERRRECNDYVFQLKSEWSGAVFELSWEEARCSRIATQIVEDSPKAKCQKIEPASTQEPIDGHLAISVSKYALYYKKMIISNALRFL